MVDDKFINDFIDDAESVSKGNNVYIIEGSRENAKHAIHPLISFVHSLNEYLNKLLTQLTLNDKIFIHWLHQGLYDFILSLSSEIKVGLFFWGGDIVETPQEVYARDNYLPLTYRYYYNYIRPFPYWFKLYKNPLNILRHIKWKWEFEKQVKKRAEKKFKAIERLNYFLNWMPLDYEWIKERSKNFNAEYIYHFYGIGEQNNPPQVIKKHKEQNSPLVFWVGNSSTEANNHLDALKVLSRFKKENIKIICPLSYGYPVQHHYTQHIIKCGKKLFGEKFYPLTQFLSRSEYYKLLWQADVVVMFHNRTQAAGNIRTFMQMGKKIFMQKANTMFQYFKNSGAVIYTNDELRQMSIDEIKRPLTEDDVLKNKIVLNKIINHSEKFKSLSQVLCCEK
jgi:hypothetical protein